MSYPQTRLRRLRRTAGLRSLVREHHLRPSDLALPLFVHHGTEPEPIEALPGHARLSIDGAVAAAKEAQAAGVKAVLLFGIPSQKDDIGSEAFDDEGIVQLAIRAIKRGAPKMTVVTDVCLCQYTSHGHCGVIRDNEVLNDVTLEVLANVAISHARAGADAIAPSDMMDGRVQVLRAALDAEHMSETAIIAYSAKYASAFYGPFRAAAGSAPEHGDRRGYQMDPANGREAHREIALDIEEGADIVMVKPALAYLDVIARAADSFDVPIAAYQVSGEYAMLKAAAERGWLDERTATLESLISIKRAGASLIFSYAAIDAARWLEDQWKRGER